MDTNATRRSERSADQRLPAAMEWPTVLVAVGCWGGYVAMLVWHEHLPAPVALAGFALLGGWYMSLQHEVLHGHPTPWRWLNLALAMPPVSLWSPYPLYRRTHLLHHEAELTVPGVDPESFHVTEEQWRLASRPRRLLLRANRTLVGRLLIGPLLGPPALVRAELRGAMRERGRLVMWAAHLAMAVAIGWVVFVVAGVPVWQYLLGYCYFGMSVTYLRSFVEHQVVPAPATRCAVVRSGRFFGTLFLYNNLHHTHHALPGAAWYRLPQLAEELGSDRLAAEGAGLYHGYGGVVRRYGLRPFSTPVHPFMDTAAAS